MRTLITFCSGLLLGACLFSLSLVSAGPCDSDPVGQTLHEMRTAPSLPYVTPLEVPGSYRDAPRHDSGWLPNPY